ncbi:DUF2157 domain-containing protein [Hymenobacter sp. H14-R3]|uniref:DUF2157 domain-containing protein n=1 Tax=Hymenobacter sp. H14-R3 TaxID=3046308 RepID=UPI0024BAF933|nr:DUF2157 domain-containing protein [Hymenobacter sp. H14-R3]MDJ0364978.1 DUF2157 domain-containing protein [Hymenobacter sp. H14-R3]
MASTTTRLLADLTAEGLLPPAQAAAIAEDERTRPFSLHHELRALLYLGSVLLAGGLGVLIYENRDSLGQEIITAFIALAMAAAFGYAARHRPAFTWQEAPRTRIAADYLLVLSCLLFLVLEGYVQVAYGVFGTRYGLVTLLPAVLFLGLAYRFDHRGVLAMGLTALAAWVGVKVAPLALFTGQGFPAHELSGPGLLLGLGLLAVGLASERLGRKAHFAYTYLLLGSNVALVAALTRLFEVIGDAGVLRLQALLITLLVLGICTLLGWYARRTQSYLFLLLAVGYGYVAITSLVVLLAQLGGLEGVLWPLAFLYFPLTLLGIILFFINIKKILRIA